MKGDHRRGGSEVLQGAASLIDLIGDGALLLQDGRVKFANAEFLRVTGHSFNEIELLPLANLLTPQTARLMAERYKDGRLAGESPTVWEMELRKKDGGTLPVEAKAVLIQQEGIASELITFRDMRGRLVVGEELREAAKRYKAILDNPMHLVFVNDQRGLFIDANDYAIKWLGYSREELGRVYFQDIVHPEDLPKALAAVGQAVEKGYADIPVEVRIFNRAGEVHWVEATGYRLSQGGEPYRGLGVARDITDRKLAEERLRASEERFRELIENQSEGIILVDLGGKIQYQSPCNQRVTGYATGELIGKNAFDLLNSDDVPAVVEALGNLTQTSGSIASTEFRFRHKDGSWRQFEAVARNLLDNPAVQAVVVNFRDITERKRAEEAIGEAQKRYRAIFNNPLNMVYVVNEQGMVVDANDWALQRLGFSREEIGRISFVDLVHPEDLGIAMESVFEAWMKGSNRPVEARFLTKLGEMIWVESVGFLLETDGQHLKNLVIARDITDRKKVEEALLLSEQYYRSLTENSSDAIAVVGADWSVKYTSTLVERLFGYSVGMDMGTITSELAAPEDYPKMVDFFMQLMDHPGTVLSAECRMLRKDGIWGCFEVVGRNLLNDPAVSGIVINSRDITDRKKAEEALQRSEQYYRSLIENSSEAITVLNADGTIRYQTHPSGRFFGVYSPDEVLGADWMRYVDPDDLQELMNVFAQLISTPGLTKVHRQRTKTRDGSWRYVESVAMNLLHDPAVAGIVVNSRDVTERYQAEQAIRENEKKFRTIFEQANDAIIYAGTDSEVLDINTKALTLFGYSREEILGSRIFERDIFTLEEAARIAQLFKNATKGNWVTGLTEVHVKRKDGLVEPAEVSVSPITEEDGTAKGFLAILRDISERKKAEEDLARYAAELKRSNDDLEQFAYVASHDLQEPLRMVGSYVQLLARRYKGKLDADADDFIGYSVDGVSRMQALINALLSYSRVSSRGKEFESVDCQVALDRALANLQVAVEDSGAVVTHDPMPELMGDLIQLSQVFQNLIGNAIKFRKDDEAPHIHVALEEKGNDYLFSVKDNCIGFDQEYSERVFIIFKRLQRDDDKYPGTGIGLALCKKIVERHRGRIWAESQVGVGSTFYFTLPKRL